MSSASTFFTSVLSVLVTRDVIAAADNAAATSVARIARYGATIPALVCARTSVLLEVTLERFHRCRRHNHDLDIGPYDVAFHRSTSLPHRPGREVLRWKATS